MRTVQNTISNEIARSPTEFDFFGNDVCNGTSVYDNCQGGSCEAFTGPCNRAEVVCDGPVSYTHLTLPTKRIV